jgi:hypothetical protein
VKGVLQKNICSLKNYKVHENCTKFLHIKTIQSLLKKFTKVLKYSRCLKLYITFIYYIILKHVNFIVFFTKAFDKRIKFFSLVKIQENCFRIPNYFFPRIPQAFICRGILTQKRRYNKHLTVSKCN